MESLALNLKDKLDPESLIPKKQMKEMKKVDEEERFQRRKYLTAKVLNNAVQELIMAFELKALSDPGAIAAEEIKVG